MLNKCGEINDFCVCNLSTLDTVIGGVFTKQEQYAREF